MRGDIGRASKILSDGFFKDGTNFFTYQLERLETYLSLEAGFPKPDALHELFVACSTKNGQVIGMAELDVEQKGSRKADGPYLCNVSVDRKRLRQGTASRLVQECEQQVLEWNKMSGGNVPNSLYLKVRENNEAAIAMYDKFGYRTYMKEKDEKNDVDILVMRKKLDPSTYKGKISSQNNAGIRLDLSLSKPQWRLAWPFFLWMANQSSSSIVPTHSTWIEDDDDCYSDDDFHPQEYSGLVLSLPESIYWIASGTWYWRHSNDPDCHGNTLSIESSRASLRR